MFWRAAFLFKFRKSNLCGKLRKIYAFHSFCCFLYSWILFPCLYLASNCSVSLLILLSAKDSLLFMKLIFSAFDHLLYSLPSSSICWLNISEPALFTIAFLFLCVFCSRFYFLSSFIFVKHFWKCLYFVSLESSLIYHHQHWIC